MTRPVTRPRAGYMASRDGDIGPLPETEPLSILPVQWQRPQATTGERRLMVAVLERAWEDLPTFRRCIDDREWRLYDDARRYIVDGEGEEWDYSFEAICDALGVNAEAIRALVRRDFPAVVRPGRVLSDLRRGRSLRHGR